MGLIILIKLIAFLLLCSLIIFIYYEIIDHKQDQRIKYYYGLKHVLGESRARAWLNSGKPIPKGIYVPEYGSGYHINIDEIEHFYKENGIEW